MKNILTCPEDFVPSVLYVDFGDRIKAAVRTSEKCYAFADLGGKRFAEEGNLAEPFHFKDHIFYFPKELLSSVRDFTVTFRFRVENSVFHQQGDVIFKDLHFDPADLVSYEEEFEKMNRNLVCKEREAGEVSEGAQYAVEHYETRDGEPVVVHAFTYDAKAFTMLCGTPQGTYDFRNQKETVMDTVNYETSRGREILAAFNADFFDMFGDCAPSGLCVKDGVVVANPQSDRYFFGVKKDGTHIIDTLAGQPRLLEELEQAVCGLNLLLEDGEIRDVSLGEFFGSRTHPRTVVGLTEDDRVVILVIDGRRPWHSNGATLRECAMLLREHGAVRGVNLDGGGSSTFIVKTEDGHKMLNHPADLHRPFDDLVRDVFNSILIVKK